MDAFLKLCKKCLCPCNICRRRSRRISPAVSHTTKNGVINSTFQSDELGIGIDNDNLSSNFESVKEIPESITIQTSKTNSIHVIHLQPDPSKLERLQQSPNGSDSSEDYWFTRWTRKPRLKQKPIEDKLELQPNSIELRILKKLPNNSTQSFTNSSYDATNDDPQITVQIESDTIITTTELPLLFFIHSLCSSSDCWNEQFKYFRDLGYEIVAPDLPGHGMSNSQDYLFEDIVRELIIVFDHFVKGDRKVVLIGHGYGAPMSTILTRLRPSNVNLLICISGGGPTAFGQVKSDKWWLRRLTKRTPTPRYLNPDLLKTIPPKILKKLIGGQQWPDGDSSYYRKITVPTLLIYGMRDNIITLIEECEMERTIPKCYLEIVHTAGHMVMLDESDIVNRMIGCWLKEFE